MIMRFVVLLAVVGFGRGWTVPGAMEIGLVGGAGLLLATSSLRDGTLRQRAAVQDHIDWARTSQAPAYVQTTAVDVGPIDEEVRERRRTSSLAAEQMLSDVLVSTEAGLKEALQNGDYESAAEFEADLERVRPLPNGIQLDSRPKPADYKRWLDPNFLR